MKKYYGLYYDFIFETRMELYDTMKSFSERLTEMSSIVDNPEYKGIDFSVITIQAENYQKATDILTEEIKLIKGLK
jgi:hypothetical protein